MQETRFIEDGEMKTNIETFFAESEGEAVKKMDERLKDLAKENHILTGRYMAEKSVPESIRKKKGRKGKLLKRAFKHAF